MANGVEKLTVTVRPGVTSQLKPVLSSFSTGSAVQPRRAAALRFSMNVSPPWGCLAPGSPSSGQSWVVVRCQSHRPTLADGLETVPSPAIPMPPTSQVKGMPPSSARLPHCHLTPCQA